MSESGGDPGGGSSPLARGGRGAAASPPRPVRLIPAGAGRTSGRVSGWVSQTAHPRWRGEDVSSWPGRATGRGSSPLARGGPDQSTDIVRQIGLIPAGAGRTGVDGAHLAPSGAHPRWRGEDGQPGANATNATGSSPLARGGRSLAAPSSCGGRLIPAGAGRTCGTTGRDGGPGAHPRWRGEDTFFFISRSSSNGSSPLARGGHGRVGGLARRFGLIPAGAGRTRSVARRCRAASAHPRWRGEDPMEVTHCAWG